MSQEIKPYKAGTVLLAGWYPDHVEEAKEYIRKNELTKDDVKILSNEEGELLIIAKRDVTLKC